MVTFRHLTAPRALCHTTDLDALIGLNEGEVHIQAHSQGQAFIEHPTGNLTDIGAQGFKIGIGTVVSEGEGHRGDILHTPLDGDTHRTTIMGIHRGIVAMIDATDHHIGLTGTEFGEGHFHTIGRGAVT